MSGELTTSVPAYFTPDEAAAYQFAHTIYGAEAKENLAQLLTQHLGLSDDVAIEAVGGLATHFDHLSIDEKRSLSERLRETCQLLGPMATAEIIEVVPEVTDGASASTTDQIAPAEPVTETTALPADEDKLEEQAISSEPTTPEAEQAADPRLIKFDATRNEENNQKAIETHPDGVRNLIILPNADISVGDDTFPLNKPKSSYQDRISRQQLLSVIIDQRPKSLRMSDFKNALGKPVGAGSIKSLCAHIRDENGKPLILIEEVTPRLNLYTLAPDVVVEDRQMKPATVQLPSTPVENNVVVQLPSKDTEEVASNKSEAPATLYDALNSLADVLRLNQTEFQTLRFHFDDADIKKPPHGDIVDMLSTIEVLFDLTAEAPQLGLTASEEQAFRLMIGRSGHPPMPFRIAENVYRAAEDDENIGFKQALTNAVSKIASTRQEILDHERNTRVV